MAGALETAEKASKLPFASYDLVVYFGMGVCSLVFANRYILSTFNNKFPPIFNGFSDPLLNTTISVVALAFGAYIIGHGIAILGSILIEQFVYRSMGFPSSVMVDAAIQKPIKGNRFKSYLKTRIKYSYHEDLHWADFGRLVVHLPVLPLYFLMYVTGFHGFYESKLNRALIIRVQQRLEHHFDFSEDVIRGSRWFKIVEYSCANDHSTAMSKMYNYLMIYGLFRSAALLILAAIWFELYFWVTQGGLGFLDQAGHGHTTFRILLLYGAFGVTFIGFCKFSRRYTEEAVQAFSLSRVFKAD